MSETRGYTTWEEDFSSDRCELHGYSDELVAVVDKVGHEWAVSDRDGNEVARRARKSDAQRLAETFL